jgi:hypothetical protein
MQFLGVTICSTTLSAMCYLYIVISTSTQNSFNFVFDYLIQMDRNKHIKCVFRTKNTQILKIKIICRHIL